MNNLHLIISTSATALGLAITTATFLAKALKSAKAKKRAERLLMVSDALLPYIEKAEGFVNFSGEEKREYVLTKANQFFIDKGIKFDEVLCSQKIEELVGLTRVVNCNKGIRPQNEAKVNLNTVHSSHAYAFSNEQPAINQSPTYDDGLYNYNN